MSELLALMGQVMALLAAASASSSASPQPHMIQTERSAMLPTRPQRILSVNPCTDALLRELADPQQIAAISHYSHDPRATSVPMEWARRFTVTGGTAEEIIAQRPDLVVASAFVSPATEMALQRLNIPLLKLAIPQSVAESQRQISEFAELLGAPAKGADLNHRIDAAMERAAAPTGARIPSLIWRRGGLVPGEGTLPDQLLAHAGFANRSADYGLGAWDVLNLEPLVARPPALLLTDSDAIFHRGWNQTNRVLSHPVITKMSARIRIADYPARLLNCAGPTLISAAERLRELRQMMDAVP